MTQAATQASTPAPAEPVVRVEGLRKRYGDKLALDGVDLEVHEQEVVAVLGPSGSGKSTLVRCIHQLETIEGGAIHLDGELLGYEAHRGGYRTLSENRVCVQRRRMGMVFQQFNLFPHWTVLKNIAEPAMSVHGQSRRQAEERARDLLDRVGLADKADVHPRHLSGGQQQRVAIARAVATRPRVVLFDEPTSALDPELVGEVLKVMKDLAETGMTMVVVTHEMEFARDVATRCVFMADGKVVEEAPSDQFFSAPRSERLRSFLSRYSGERRSPTDLEKVSS
ncbi:polar amino acid transport system ATP-binding protein [Nocardioides luteus]|uniref:Arginine ABC transporter ATP-binding protein n=1 Tax=Nocardioides luteus TaxID=1844 RepID=A0ABQ5SYF7_9ACTN|nr:amino acid ABC transporter ATP-binding protein [Nocardioides luteus]MDR7312621.1 polar amino acid transport system ATP-binding protein [Nocardioides luteus]GGR46368.1 arginine ABC transporter ATP-binding protein [Nocardioides luteus]GLJ68869.1 arginine ABC transporter ATP-binding protein [Nocardioides luteus]